MIYNNCYLDLNDKNNKSLLLVLCVTIFAEISLGIQDFVFIILQAIFARESAYPPEEGFKKR
jgi:hypothetical protein